MVTTQAHQEQISAVLRGRLAFAVAVQGRDLHQDGTEVGPSVPINPPTTKVPTWGTQTVNAINCVDPDGACLYYVWVGPTDDTGVGRSVVILASDDLSLRLPADLDSPPGTEERYDADARPGPRWTPVGRAPRPYRLGGEGRS